MKYLKELQNAFKELLKNYHIKTGVDKFKELPAESTTTEKEKILKYYLTVVEHNQMT